jgi:hypothetical protein
MAHGVTINGAMGVEDTKSMGIWQGAAMDSLIIARVCHALPFYDLRAATPETAIPLFQGWPPAGQAGCICLRPLAFKCIKIHLFKKKIVLGCIKIHLSLKQGDHLIPRCEGIAM